MLWWQRTALLAWLAMGLVKVDPLERADLVVVLAGGPSGERILKGGQLVREGFAQLALVSGPIGYYGLNECEASIPFAARRGYGPELYYCVPNHTQSTREEAKVMMAEARRRYARRVLIVTSDFHTRRARYLYRQAAPDLDIRVIAAPNLLFKLDRWWENRDSKKLVLLEIVKTLTEPFGI